jgi:hypothetical protein
MRLRVFAESPMSSGLLLGIFPRAEAVAFDALALPIYAELTEDQQRYVVEQMGSFSQSAQRL